MLTYGNDGKCHNAQRGTYNHECGKPAEYIGTSETGFECGFCAHCRKYGDERTQFVTWRKITPIGD